MSLPEIGTWTEGPSLPEPAGRCGYSIVQNKMFCIGGYNSGYLDYVQFYDIESGNWHLGKSMPSKRGYLGCAVSENQIYCIGGVGNDGLLDLVEVYDTETDQWKSAANMPIAAQSFATIYHDGKIYCIGNYRAPRTSVQIYDISTNTWHIGASSPVDIYDASGAVVNNQLFIATSGTEYMVVYDITTDSWKIDSAKRFGVKSTGNCTLKGEYLFYAGQDFEIYDLIKQQWYVGMRTNLINDAGCFSGNSFYGLGSNGRFYIFTFGINPAIIHRFQNEAGGYIQPLFDTFSVEAGINYTTSIPYITGYSFVGYKIDAGDLVTDGSLPVIEDVQVDHSIFFIYRQGGIPVTTHTVTEQFHSVDGVALKGEAEKLIPDGEDYVATAPAISGWRYVGWQLDGGPVQNGTASIPAVDGDHTITFLYEEDGNGEDSYTVTESYLNLVDSSFLQADTYTQVTAGGSYGKTAPEINGYKRVGHSIDSGTNSGELTASIPLVSSDHQVFFLYVKDEEGGGNQGGDCKCCCTKLEIKLTTCGDNQMVRDFCDIVKKYKDKDCCC